MNIGIDIRCLMHKNYSGVAEYTYNLLDNLFKIDNKNQYKLFFNSSQNVTLNLPQFHYSNVKFFGFKYPNKLFNTSLKYLKYPKIDHLIKGVDLFFTPNMIFSSLSKECRNLLTIHDLSFVRFPEFFSQKRNFWHRFINPTNLCFEAEKIIADSKNTKNDLVNLYNIDPEKIKVIHLGVDTSFYRPINEDDPKLKNLSQKYELPESFILYLGTLEPRKNIESLIESFDLFKTKHQDKFADLHLVIAGQPGWNYKNIFKTAQKAKFSEQIKFIGYIKKNDKPYLYNLAQILLFPSFYEGFGLPVLEAQACGTPVISGINSSLPEISGDSAYLIRSDYINELRQAIYRLLSNKKLRRNYIQAGLINAKNFSWQKTASQTLEIFTL